MKPVDLLPVSLSALLLAGSTATVILPISTTPLYAQNNTVGKFACKFTPEDLNNRTLRVDGNMVAMSEEFYVPPKSISSDTPSIFFIIDNSGSMISNPGTDRDGNRFTVTSALLDTLQKNYPSVEVGLSIFGSTLSFDPADKPYFVTCPGQQGAYVPLLQLGKIYPAYGNMTGYAILKEILATNNGILAYVPTNNALTANHTNITAGFDAAKNAFLSSVNAADHGAQFIIFFSDGEANIPGTANPADSNETFRFTSGTNTPTTFTVFFSTDNPPTILSTISSMTDNIKSNGWSPNNPKSAFWGYQNTTQAALMDFLMTNVLSAITLKDSRSEPKGISIGGATATNWANGRFTFPALFPLTGTVTPFNFSVIYSIYENSVFIKDTAHSITDLNIQIDPARTLPADSFDVRHWDRNLNLRNNNARIAAITETMDSLELVFVYDPGTALYNYTNIKVQVYNQLGTIRDNETFTLNKNADTFSIKFKKMVSTLPIPGNKVFEIQGVAGDSLVAIFRNSENPVLPLDTLRIAVPMNVTLLASLTTAITRDFDGDGFIDHIQISFDRVVALTNAMSTGFLLKGNGYVFPVDSITKITDSTYLLCLHEVTTSLPQTSWTPDLSMTFLPDIQTVVNFRTTDGCPPVVWAVKKNVTGSDRTRDTVKIFISEKITGSTGNPFNIQTLPSDVFNTWVAQGSLLVKADAMFDGIQGFTAIISDSILVFTMSNGKDLSTNSYINIRSENSLIKDMPGNLPTAVNQRVQVQVLNSAIYGNGLRSALPNSLKLSAIQKKGSVTITAGLPSTCIVGAITLFNISGKKLAERTISGSGWHTFSVEQISAGAHLLRLSAGGHTIMRKMLIY